VRLAKAVGQVRRSRRARPSWESAIRRGLAARLKDALGERYDCVELDGDG
jgi:hypothetical protein